MKLILMLLIRIMNLKMLFSMVIFKDSFRLNLAYLKELNMNFVVIINMKILKIEEKNCFLPTKGYCFTKCIISLTGGAYKQQYLGFIRNEKRRSNLMTKSRI